MKTPVFTGVSTAIVTPFRNGGVHHEKFAQLIDMQIAGGVSAITVCGTTGESSTHTLEEHMETVDFCIKHVAGRVKVIAGCGSNDTQAALELSISAENSGADALLHVTPYYNKTSQNGLIRHYTYLADRVKTPIIMYNVPSRTGCSCKASTYKILSQHPMINGLKEASGDFSLIAETFALCGDDLNVWSGNDDQAVAMMALGAKGLISVAANIIPETVSEMCRLALEGDFKAATKLQLESLDIMNALFIEVNPIPVKTALNLMGYAVGALRLPLCDMEEANLEKLRQSMIDFGLEVK